METFFESLNNISTKNIIYTVILVATATERDLRFFINPLEIIDYLIMSFNTTLNTYILPGEGKVSPSSLRDYDGYLSLDMDQKSKPSLITRLYKRLALYLDSITIYLQRQINEHTATSIASLSVLIIVISIICCFIISLVHEEERKIKEQYRKLNGGSSSSLLAIKNESCAMRIIQLRRETYYGLVRLLKPGCRSIVLLCDTQSRNKLLTKYYQCVYPYRKNKTLQFAFLLIEKNIEWYRDLLKLALGEKRDLQINPLNCVGTVIALNGFKKYFSVYHASDSRFNRDEPFVLLEESLLDNLPEWLEKLFAGKVSRYYVSYWPDGMR